MGYLKATLVGATSSLLCTLLLLSTAYARADERTPQSFDIRPQSLAAALSEFARQSHEEILFAPDVVAEKRSGGVRGTMQPLAALKILLNDSALPFSSTPSGAILIGRAGASPVISAAEASDSSQKEGKKSSSGAFRVAQVDQGTNSQFSAVGTAAAKTEEGDKKAQLSEIIVTAQKKSERLQDVPVPVSVLSPQALLSSNAVKIQDFYTTVPGVSVMPGDFGNNMSITIRSVSTGGGNPTVGTVIDDVPFGASTGLAGGTSAVDIDPSDLASIEVLRGPQGTLYGASSIGGLLKYVTLDPSTDAVSGRVQAGVSGVYNGAQLGYNVRAAVNVPISDTVAVRASAFTRRDPGYIDDVVSGKNGINEVDVDGGRLSALWRPSDLFSLKLSALLQEFRSYGSPEADPTLGDLKQSSVPGSGSFSKNSQAYSAILKAHLGAFDLTSLTGYSLSKVQDLVDFSALYGPYIGFGVNGALLTDDGKTTKYSQEIRVSTSIDKKLDWLFGAFYTHEKTPWVETFLAAVPTTGQEVGVFENSDSYPTTYEEYAAFTDLTLHVTDKFDVQLGGRESENRQTYTETIVGNIDSVFFGAPGPIVNPEEVTKDNSFTYLVTPTFKVSPDLMIYGRLASGYRPGGPNPTAVIFDLPPRFGPDKTRNYEIGAKGSAFSNKFLFDASVYYIDWKNIQLQLTQPASGATYYTNASEAKSQGVELSTEFKPLTGLNLAAWVAWNGAVLTKGFPPGSAAYGVSGDKLPFSARYSGNFSVDEIVPLTTQLNGSVGGSVSYVGSREGVFIGTSKPRQDLPAYTLTNLHAALNYELWTLNFFANNVMDRRGILSGGIGALHPIDFVYITPRTVGLSVVRTF